MKHTTYRRYRGTSRRIGVIIPVLLMLCLIAAAALIYVNANLTQGERGEMMLRLPFSDKTVSFGGDEHEEVNLIVEDPIIIEEPVADEYESRVENPIFIPKDVVLDEAKLDDAIAKAKEVGANVAVLEVKAEDGSLIYEGNEEQIKSALLQISDAELVPIAQISCFKDNKAARENQELACRTKNKVIWLDKTNTTWLSPYSTGAREYIAGVINDVYSLGFKEILLSNLSFPTSGKTDILYYGEEVTKQEAIKLFMEEVKLLCQQKGDLRAAIIYNNVDEEQSGLNIGDVVEHFYRIYVSSSAPDNAQDALNAEEVNTRLVKFDEKLYTEEDETPR